MKLVSLVLVLLCGSLAMASNESERYFRLGRVITVPVIESNDSKPVMDRCTPGSSANRKEIGDEIDGVGVIIDKIVNIGKKVWAIIEMGRPVYNVKTDVAHALPAGIECWSDLENWKAPQSKAWKVTYENQMGGKVVEFVYRVSYIAGGQYKGLGHYITQATVSVASLYVAWGYKFNVEGSVPSVFNMGTRANPVAGMQLNMKWSVDTVINHHEKDQQFYVNGLGEFQKMQGQESSF